MSIDIKVFDNLRNLQFKLDNKQLGEHIVFPAARRSINRAVRDSKPRAVKEVQSIFKLKKSAILKKKDKQRRDFLSLVMAKGDSLAELHGELKIRNVTFNLRNFLKGSKHPVRPKQLGVPVRKRKPLSFEIIPGRKSKPKGLFLADGRSPNGKRTGPLVFRRSPSGKGVKRGQTSLIPQNVGGILNKLLRAKADDRLKTFMRERFEREYERDVAKRISQFIQPSQPKRRK